MGWDCKDKDNASSWKSRKALYLKIRELAGLVVEDICNPSQHWEVEAQRKAKSSLATCQVQGHPGLPKDPVSK